jgi:hypothetical protein
MSRQVFLTFADQRMKAGRKRICQQAREMDINTDIIGASDKDRNRSEGWTARSEHRHG